MKGFYINPLKKSAVLGATFGVLGFKNSIPIHHGSQGCTAFIKNIMTQHFREIVPMQSTAIFNMALIMGGYSEILEGINNVVSKSNPDTVGLITTGISQVRGDDIKYAIRQYYEKYPESNTVVIPVEVSDFNGDAETGFAEAVLSYMKEIEFAGYEDKSMMIISNFSLTCGDIDEIKSIVSSFGLNPVVIPDISESLGGSFNNYYKITPGGAEFSKIMKKPVCAVGIGHSTAPILSLLKEKGIFVKEFPTLIGLKNTDKFLDFLSELTNKLPERSILKMRGQLVDMMLDSHFYFNKKSVAIAVEPDFLYGLKSFLVDELGIQLKRGVTTYYHEDLSDIKDILVEDLFELEKDMGEIDILLSNSNGELLSEKYNKPIIKLGFPVKDEIGYPLNIFNGYRGSINLLKNVANIFLRMDEEKSYEYKNYKGVKYYESRIL